MEEIEMTAEQSWKEYNDRKAAQMAVQATRSNKMKDAYEVQYNKLHAALPALTGTEKQVAWAERIRTTATALLCRSWGTYKSRTGRMVEAVTDKDLARITAAANTLSERTAATWIARRQMWGC